MNHAQLHTLQGPNKEPFENLFTDQRFVGLLMYLKANRPRGVIGEPHQMIFEAGRVEGWMGCVEDIEKIKTPPPPQIPHTPRQPYAAPRHPENNQP